MSWEAVPRRRWVSARTRCPSGSERSLCLSSVPCPPTLCSLGLRGHPVTPRGPEPLKGETLVSVYSLQPRSSERGVGGSRQTCLVQEPTVDAASRFRAPHPTAEMRAEKPEASPHWPGPFSSQPRRRFRKTVFLPQASHRAHGPPRCSPCLPSGPLGPLHPHPPGPLRGLGC